MEAIRSALRIQCRPCPAGWPRWPERPEFAKGFVLLPKRWRVEQSIGALTISRRLKIDYETLAHVSAAAMLSASIGRLLASVTMP